MQKTVVQLESVHNGKADSDTKVSGISAAVSVRRPDLQDNFPFENLVFEGGSNKLLPYCGAIRVLEETGIWSQIRRLAGTGSGAIAATLCSVGYTSHQLEDLFQDDLRNIDNTGSSCIGCKLSSKFGINRTKKLLKWIGNRLQEVTGDPDVTFAWVHNKFNKELAITVTNVQQASLEFCHVKTTPDMPIREALCMSLAVPGLFQPVTQRKEAAAAGIGEKEIFVEGAVICNYPINCFDDWWLSMKPGDAFIRRLDKLSELSRSIDSENRFGKYNPRTIGIIVFDDMSADSVSAQVMARDRKTNPATSSSSSNTLLRGIRQKSTKETESLSEEYSRFVSAANKFIQLIETKVKSRTDAVNRNDISDTLAKGTLNEDELRRLFGGNVNVDTILRQFGREKVTVDDILNHFERRRRIAQAQCSRDQRRKIRDVTDYFEALNETFERHSRRHCFKRKDIDRTVAISTGHIRRTDRGETLEEADRLFLVKQGSVAMRSFLEQFLSSSSCPSSGVMSKGKDAEEVDDLGRRSFCRDDLHRFIDDDVSEIIDERDYMETYRGI